MSLLRKLAGDNLGANLDPSHLFWQGIDPVEAARTLGDAGAIFHSHAKDTALDPRNTRVNGVLDHDRDSRVHAVLLRGHGLYTWGRTIADAERHIEILEFLLEAVGRRSQPWR